MAYFNKQMKDMGKTGWFLMDHCAMHSLPPDAEATMWDTADLKFSGFKMSNISTFCTYLLEQPVDQGIIRAFKAISRRYHVPWIISMLDSCAVERASKARPTIRNAIERTNAAWDQVSVNIMRNSWNHAKN
jgi:hypothetical protein